MPTLKTCRRCPASVIYAQFSGKESWGQFDAAPIADPLKDTHKHWIVSGRTAAKPEPYAEQLMVTREVDLDAARAFVRTLAWFQLHECPNYQPSETSTE